MFNWHEVIDHLLTNAAHHARSSTCSKEEPSEREVEQG